MANTIFSLKESLFLKKRTPPTYTSKDTVTATIKRSVNKAIKENELLFQNAAYALFSEISNRDFDDAKVRLFLIWSSRQYLNEWSCMSKKNAIVESSLKNSERLESLLYYYSYASQSQNRSACIKEIKDCFDTILKKDDDSRFLMFTLRNAHHTFGKIVSWDSFSRELSICIVNTEKSEDRQSVYMVTKVLLHDCSDDQIFDKSRLNALLSNDYTTIYRDARAKESTYSECFQERNSCGILAPFRMLSYVHSEFQEKPQEKRSFDSLWRKIINKWGRGLVAKEGSDTFETFLKEYRVRHLKNNAYRFQNNERPCLVDAIREIPNLNLNLNPDYQKKVFDTIVYRILREYGSLIETGALKQDLNVVLKTALEKPYILKNIPSLRQSQFLGLYSRSLERGFASPSRLDVKSSLLFFLNCMTPLSELNKEGGGSLPTAIQMNLFVFKTIRLFISGVKTDPLVKEESARCLFGSEFNGHLHTLFKQLVVQPFKYIKEDDFSLLTKAEQSSFYDMYDQLTQLIASLTLFQGIKREMSRYPILTFLDENKSFFEGEARRFKTQFTEGAFRAPFEKKLAFTFLNWCIETENQLISDSDNRYFFSFWSIFENKNIVEQIAQELCVKDACGNVTFENTFQWDSLEASSLRLLARLVSLDFSQDMPYLSTRFSESSSLFLFYENKEKHCPDSQCKRAYDKLVVEIGDLKKVSDCKKIMWLFLMVLFFLIALLALTQEEHTPVSLNGSKKKTEFYGESLKEVIFSNHDNERVSLCYNALMLICKTIEKNI